MKTKPKPVYKADDDSEHKSASAAERWNKLLKAKEAFEAAGQEVMKCLGATAMTADGEPFDMTSSHRYWFVRESWSGLPLLADVWLYPYLADIETDRETGAIVLSEYDRDRKEMVQYRLHELFYDEKKAKEAHIAACHQRLEELTADVSKMTQRN